jgi:cytochrome c553
MLTNLVTLCGSCHEDEEREAKARSLDTRPPTHLPDRRERESQNKAAQGSEPWLVHKQ